MSKEYVSPGQEGQDALIIRASKTDPRTRETIYARDYGLKGYQS